MPPRSDADFMREALSLAASAAARGEVPVGAVLVLGDEVIARASNAPISSHDPSAHAEIVALRAAGVQLRRYRFPDARLYVSLEPCIMCASAIIHARLNRVVFGAWDPKAGGAGSVLNIFTIPALNHRVDVFGGVLADESAAILRQFFALRR